MTFIAKYAHLRCAAQSGTSFYEYSTKLNKIPSTVKFAEENVLTSCVCTLRLKVKVYKGTKRLKLIRLL